VSRVVFRPYHPALAEARSSFSVEGESVGAIVVSLKDPRGVVVKTAEAKDGKISWKFRTDELALWYPVHYGSQPIYAVEVNLIGTKISSPIASRTIKTGFRRARVVQEPLEGQPGTSFVFEINNVRIFCGGANWIPADSFLTKSVHASQTLLGVLRRPC
jgi:beta-mannosidase